MARVTWTVRSRARCSSRRWIVALPIIRRPNSSMPGISIWLASAAWTWAGSSICIASSRVRMPRSSRTEPGQLVASSLAADSERCSERRTASCWTSARRVVGSGSSISTTMPQRNRLTRPLLKRAMSCGCSSDARASRAPVSSMASSVWRNSTCVFFLFDRKCTSSMASSRSPRWALRNRSIDPSWMAVMYSFVNCSPVTYRIRERSPIRSRGPPAEALEQVCLSEPAATVDEQGGDGGSFALFGQSAGRRPGESIAFTDDEPVQACQAGPTGCGLHSGWGRPPPPISIGGGRPRAPCAPVALPWLFVPACSRWSLRVDSDVDIGSRTERFLSNRAKCSVESVIDPVRDELRSCLDLHPCTIDGNVGLSEPHRVAMLADVFAEATGDCVGGLGHGYQ